MIFIFIVFSYSTYRELGTKRIQLFFGERERERERGCQVELEEEGVVVGGQE